MSVIELRQYTLHAGRRDELIELFEREFVESQEACGIELVGTFRDVSDPERFVWLRRFPDMVARAASLEAFYDGAVWREHRTAANATMVDSDDVLLLRPVSDRFDVARKRRTASAEAGPRGSALALSIADVSGWDEDAVTAAFESDVAPALVAAGFSLVAGWVTAHDRTPSRGFRSARMPMSWCGSAQEPVRCKTYPSRVCRGRSRLVACFQRLARCCSRTRRGVAKPMRLRL